MSHQPGKLQGISNWPIYLTHENSVEIGCRNCRVSTACNATLAGHFLRRGPNKRENRGVPVPVVCKPLLGSFREQPSKALLKEIAAEESAEAEGNNSISRASVDKGKSSCSRGATSDTQGLLPLSS